MQYYSTERIGHTLELTPEGFLLCHDVPIARIGWMVYGPGETPIQVGTDGIAEIERDVEQVFRPETIASFNGKPVVNGHPAEDVRPGNWNLLSVGVVLDVRRGPEADGKSDLLLADLLITNQSAIEAVQSGLKEVSCGYDADYVQTGPGRGRQINIIGNHVALVESGRCGPRCAIGDQKTVRTGDNTMATWLDKLKAAFAGKDEAAFNAALAEAPKGDGTVTLTPAQMTTIVGLTRDALTKDEHGANCDCKDCKDKRMSKDSGFTKDAVVNAVFADKRFTDLSADVKKIADAVAGEEEEDEDEEDDKEIEGNLEEEAPPGTGDGLAAKAKDSAYIADSFQESVALAEIIAPGVQVPTFDKAADPRKTYDSLCQFRRRVIDLAVSQPDLATFISNSTSGRDVKKFTCDAVRTLFLAVGNHKRALNNAAAARDQLRTNQSSGNGSGPVSPDLATPADLNRRMAEFYSQSQ